MNPKKVVVALVAVLILGALFGWLGSRTQNAPTTKVQQQDLLGGSATTTGGYEYAESTGTYTVSLLYPGATQLSDPAADQQARLTVEAGLKQELDDFKENVQGLDAAILPSLADGHKLELEATYKTYAGSGTVSYLYTIFADTGGAHPNTYFKTFVFDQTGTTTSIAAYANLQKLATIVSADVTKQAQERLQEQDVSGAIFAEGLTPTENNYSNFVIDGSDILVEIPPYQVAAYVLGSFEVRVPLAQVK